MQTIIYKPSPSRYSDSHAPQKREYPNSIWTATLLLMALGLSHLRLQAQSPIAHWRMEETQEPYRDQSTESYPLLRDYSTASAFSDAGVCGKGAHLNYQEDPGIATRLYAFHPRIQTDSFGFSMWIRPVQLNPGDFILTKEMRNFTGIPDYTRYAWSLGIKDTGSSGQAAVELIVRGTDRNEGDFFGSVLSSNFLPLQSDSDEWIHLAGGYDTVSGELTLYMNGVKSASTNSRPGAINSDGGAIAVGSARNGSDFIGYAGSSIIDDLQLYNGPLSETQTATLKENPGSTLKNELELLDVTLAPTQGYQVGYRAIAGESYAIQASRALPGFQSIKTEKGDLELKWDADTMGPWVVPGIEGTSLRMIWDTLNTSTRLYADHPSLQQDSFGFSLWIKPVYLNPFDNLLAKEMAPIATGPLYSRLSWQLHVRENLGNNQASLQLVVRGSNRAHGNFFGSVNSTLTVPLYEESDNWIHLAGGYDTETGDLRLYVNGEESISTNSSPGATHSDGSPLTLGSARNGLDFVAFSGLTRMDDLRIFHFPPTLEEVSKLREYPGQTSTQSPRSIARWLLNEPYPPYSDRAGMDHIFQSQIGNDTVNALPAPYENAPVFFRIKHLDPSGF